jgi:hypothetical protein
LGALTTKRIIVYPLFASSGYFTRDRLVQLLEEAEPTIMRAESPTILQNMHLPYIFTPACRPPFAALDRQRCRDDSCD